MAAERRPGRRVLDRIWPDVREDVDDEIRHHVEERTDRLVAAGWDRERAVREARRRFGDVGRTRITLLRIGRSRTMKRTVEAALHALWRDVAYALRTLRASPGFTATVVVTLAVCIGANATVLSALHALVLKPHPFENPDGLVQLFNLREARSPDNPYSESSWLQYVDLRSRAALVEGAALRSPITKLVERDGTTQRLDGQSATADLFDLLGVQPVLGRFFVPDEVDPGPGHVIVLSRTWWERELDADPNVLGRRLVLDGGVPYTVIGVAPRTMEALDPRARFTIPYAVDERERSPSRGRYQAHSHDLWLRLRPGVRRDAALERISAIERDWYRDAADADGRRDFEAYDGRVQFDLPHPLAGSLFLLQGASLFVFLTGVFNVGILFLVRLTRRRRQLSIRASLGASVAAIRRLVSIEGGMLGMAGAVVGIPIAWRGTAAINGYLTTLSPYTSPIHLDGAMLAATVGLSLAVVGVASLLPLELLRRAGLLGRVVDVRGAGTHGRLTARLGHAMAGAQVATAFVLLIGAGLLLTSFRNVLAVDPGFAADQVVEGRLDFGTVRTFYPSRDDAGELKQRIVEAMREMPGVDDVGLSMFPMLSHDLRAGGRDFMSVVGGAPSAAGTETFQPSANYVSPGFFAAMGIPILAGRACGPEDTARSVVVDELLARRTFGDASPVGLEITTQISARPETVIGVSGRANLRGPEQRDIQPFYYRCEPVRTGWWEYSILLRTSREPTDVIREMRDRLRAIDPRLPLSYASSLREALDETVLVRKAVTLLQSAFAGLAVFLSLVGVFAVLASSVAERRREIGIRLAVGARPGDVHRLILAKGLLTTAIGLGAGTIGAATLRGLLERFLFDVTAWDASTLLAVAGVFLVAALGACLLPARHAAGVDPVESMRTG